MVDMKHGKVYTPACMPASGVNFTGETAWVYGWGATEAFSDYPIEDTLRCIGVWVYGCMAGTPQRCFQTTLRTLSDSSPHKGCHILALTWQNSLLVGIATI